AVIVRHAWAPWTISRRVVRFRWTENRRRTYRAANLKSKLTCLPLTCLHQRTMMRTPSTEVRDEPQAARRYAHEKDLREGSARRRWRRCSTEPRARPGQGRDHQGDQDRSLAPAHGCVRDRGSEAPRWLRVLVAP